MITSFTHNGYQYLPQFIRAGRRFWIRTDAAGVQLMRCLPINAARREVIAAFQA